MMYVDSEVMEALVALDKASEILDTTLKRGMADLIAQEIVRFAERYSRYPKMPPYGITLAIKIFQRGDIKI